MVRGSAMRCVVVVARSPVRFTVLASRPFSVYCSRRAVLARAAIGVATRSKSPRPPSAGVSPPRTASRAARPRSALRLGTRQRTTSEPDISVTTQKYLLSCTIGRRFSSSVSWEAGQSLGRSRRSAALAPLDGHPRRRLRRRLADWQREQPGPRPRRHRVLPRRAHRALGHRLPARQLDDRPRGRDGRRRLGVQRRRPLHVPARAQVAGRAARGQGRRDARQRVRACVGGCPAHLFPRLAF